MSRRLKGWTVLAAFLGTAVYAIAEDVTISTYYPSPKGIYQELRVTENMTIGSATAPTARLQIIQPNAAAALRIEDQAADPSPFLIDQNGNVGIGTASPNSLLRVEGDIAGAKFKDTSDFNYYVDPGNAGIAGAFNGNVGIGTLAPTAKLEVAGKIRSQTTDNTDSGNTVATKDYVDAAAGGGGCFNRFCGTCTFGCSPPPVRLGRPTKGSSISLKPPPLRRQPVGVMHGRAVTSLRQTCGDSKAT